jgi:hypothetical protein
MLPLSILNHLEFPMNPIHEKLAKALLASGVVLIAHSAIADDNKNKLRGENKKIYSVITEDDNEAKKVNSWNAGCDSSCNSGCYV